MLRYVPEPVAKVGNRVGVHHGRNIPVSARWSDGHTGWRPRAVPVRTATQSTEVSRLDDCTASSCSHECLGTALTGVIRRGGLENWSFGFEGWESGQNYSVATRQKHSRRRSVANAIALGLGGLLLAYSLPPIGPICGWLPRQPGRNHRVRGQRRMSILEASATGWPRWTGAISGAVDLYEVVPLDQPLSTSR